MALTSKKLLVLTLLRRHWYLRTYQFKQEFLRTGLLKKDDDSAVTRGVLRQLEKESLIRRHEPKMVDPRSGGVAPIFVLTVKGAAVLAKELNDTSLLLTHEQNFSDWMSLNHATYVAGLHLITDAATHNQDYVQLHQLVYEHEVAQPGADDPSKKSTGRKKAKRCG